MIIYITNDIISFRAYILTLIKEDSFEWNNRFCILIYYLFFIVLDYITLPEVINFLIFVNIK